MYKKSFLNHLFVGVLVVGIMATLITSLLWPCIAEVTCENGNTIRCDSGFCGNEAQCNAYEGYVVCICSSSGTFIVNKCSGTIKTPSFPPN